ncbi:UNVERIFIED_CONTAM: Heavy metal-associated isoprenylated plant protein 35 [Sesamum angustifolium]|uniref:Heavy metal-associated isoprenylated plant protein 35 n=1 Tax=Sesamum angustifolium TaxID=2727405 RepID=A0AAW2QAH0_9LAMI
MAETADEPEPVKTCVLKASIHCEGCKRKVKKILSQVQGVEFVDVDTKQQKVTVTGSVDADTLVKKLVKAGKKAQLWPQKPEKVPGNERYKEKENHQTQPKMDDQEAIPTAEIAAKEPQPAKKDELPAKKTEGGAKAAEDGGAAKSNEETGGGASKVVKDASVETGSAVQETKAEEKKTEEGHSAGGELPQAEEQKEAAEKSNGGTSGKKKKKRGQSGSAQSSAAGLENQEAGPPPPTNHGPPRHHHYPPPPPQYYYTPPPQPVPVVSYNTAYPSSSYTASYCAAPPPPYSYAYMHPGTETQPPPPDLDSHPRQPLDSFEIFSDENPNGCFIM